MDRPNLIKSTKQQLFQFISLLPTKLCIKFAPYLHHKSANGALNMELSFRALLWTFKIRAK